MIYMKQHSSLSESWRILKKQESPYHIENRLQCVVEHALIILEHFVKATNENLRTLSIPLSQRIVPSCENVFQGRAAQNGNARVEIQQSVY